jgi:hypothetical protein
MCVVDRVILALADVRRERLTVVSIGLGVVWLAVVADEVHDEWIRACRVVRRVGKSEDVFVLADGESFNLAELGDLPPICWTVY